MARISLANSPNLNSDFAMSKTEYREAETISGSLARASQRQRRGVRRRPGGGARLRGAGAGEARRAPPAPVPRGGRWQH